MNAVHVCGPDSNPHSNLTKTSESYSQPKESGSTRPHLIGTVVLLVDSQRLLVCNDRLLICLQPFIEDTPQDALEVQSNLLMEKGSRTIALRHERDSAHDLVPPIQAHMYSLRLGRTQQVERPTSTVGLLKLQSRTEQIECNQEMGTTGSYQLSPSPALGNHGYPV